MGKVRRIARQEGVSPRLLRALIRQESGNNPGARSPTGAIGRTQLMPGTARSLGVNPYNDTQNVRGGARYLRQQLDRFGGDRRKALAAYNAGPGAVEKYGGVPPYAETQNYVRSILRNAGKGNGGAAGGTRSLSMTMGSPSQFNSRRVSSFDRAGFQQAQRRSILAQMLQRSGHGNSVLFRTGLLSTQTPNPADFTSTRLRTSITPGTDPTLTLGALEHQGGLPVGEARAAVKAARNRLGISEVGSSNRGPQVDKMSRKFGLVGVPWCGIFVGTVLRKAGVQVDSRIASVAEIERMGRNHDGQFRGFSAGARGARTGDLLITRKGQHVAFIERIGKDGTIHTIGGNESGRVQRSSYRPGSVYGSVRVRYRR